MTDTDLPTLQQRVERVLNKAQINYEMRHWPASQIAALLHGMHHEFADDDENEIAHAASRWLDKVNR